MKNINKNKQRDRTWIQLIKEAKVIGLTKEEVRLFLLRAQKNK